MLINAKPHQNNNQIPIELEKYFKKSNVLETNSQMVCSMCLNYFNHFNDTNNVCLLNCKHYFHISCIKNYLEIKEKCPCCKKYAHAFPVSKHVNTQVLLCLNKKTNNPVEFFIKILLKWKFTNPDFDEYLKIAQLINPSFILNLLGTCAGKACKFQKCFSIGIYICKMALEQNACAVIQSACCEFLMGIHKITKNKTLNINKIYEHFLQSDKKETFVHNVCDFYKKYDMNNLKYTLILEHGIKEKIPNCYNKLGLYYMKDKKYEQAVEQFKLAFELKCYSGGLNLADYYSNIANDFAQAEKYLEIIINETNELKPYGLSKLLEIIYSQDSNRALGYIDSIDKSNLNNICVLIEFFKSVGIEDKSNEFFILGYQLFNKTHLSEIDNLKATNKLIDKIEKSIGLLIKKSHFSIHIFSQDKDGFPFGFYLYSQLVKGTPINNISMNSQCVKMLNNFYQKYE